VRLRRGLEPRYSVLDEFQIFEHAYSFLIRFFNNYLVYFTPLFAFFYFANINYIFHLTVVTATLIFEKRFISFWKNKSYIYWSTPFASFFSIHILYDELCRFWDYQQVMICTLCWVAMAIDNISSYYNRREVLPWTSKHCVSVYNSAKNIYLFFAFWPIIVIWVLLYHSVLILFEVCAWLL